MSKNKSDKVKHKRPPFSCRKIKCNMMNHNTSVILYDQNCYIYNLSIVSTILMMWLFGLSGLIIGMEIGVFELAIGICLVFAVLGYLFSRSFLYGKLVKIFSIDQIKKITCDREMVRIFLAEKNEMIEMKMAPHYQTMLLVQVGNSMRTDFDLNPQVEPNLLWIKN